MSLKNIASSIKFAIREITEKPLRQLEDQTNTNIKDQKIKDELKNLTSHAFDNDIFGAPTFVINDKLFWGQDRLDYALDELNC